jgi:orotidine-5'-phosphate decarboxylase
MSKLCFPLDCSDLRDALTWVDRLAGHVDVFKVGTELFYSVGSQVVWMLHERGQEVFLDLKLHDIPTTMERTAVVLSRLRPEFLTVHVAADVDAMRGVASAMGETKVLGVTVLTSTAGAFRHEMLSLVDDAMKAGLAGVVCGGRYTFDIKRRWPEILVATPGIRPSGCQSDDQASTMTPEDAVNHGSDVLIVGRPIRDAEDPVEMADRIRLEMKLPG